MIGSDDTCFSRCSSSSAPCTCVRDMLVDVERDQRQFRDDNNATLAISTERIGNMDTRAAAHMQGPGSLLACSSQAGMCYGSTSDDTLTTAMNAFTQVLSLLLFDDNSETPNIYVADAYIDAFDLGSIITLFSTVYNFNGPRLVCRGRRRHPVVRGRQSHRAILERGKRRDQQLQP